MSALLAGEAALAVLALATLVGVVRPVRGPSLADRVVTLDLLGMIALGLMAAAAVVLEEPVLLDVALLVALVAFRGTVAFARYLEGGER